MATIAEIAGGDDFSILLRTVQFIDANLEGSNLVGALSGDTDLTVFAPTNAAFGQLAVNLGYTGDPADADAVLQFLAGNVDVATLNAVVTYHVLPGAQSAADIAASPTLTTLQGGTITADLPTLVDNEPDLLDPSLIATDIMASNGIVHVIDQVLLPVNLPGNDAPTITEIVLTSGTGFDTNGQDFDLLREAVVAANLAGALDDPNADLTTFAPNDAAFVGLAQTLGFDGSDEAGAFGYIVSALRLLSKGEDPIPLLEAILTYHVAPESLQSSQVLQLQSIPTLLGVDLGRDGASLVDAEPDIADPNLIALDIQASNGIVHVLDGVLLPADLLTSDGSQDVDFVIAGESADTIYTGLDNDFIDGGAGRDRIYAGEGDDVVLGGADSDVVFGGEGDDYLKGEDGHDRIFGGQGDDEMFGGAGYDRMFGGSGNDTMDGGADRDLMFGSRGDDDMQGGAGWDRMFGGSGNDTMDGGADRDLMYGSWGSDDMNCGTGHDLMFGGSGNDTMAGGEGDDVLFGGSGADTFVFDANSGDDIIHGFSTRQGDQIDLTAYGFESFDDIEGHINLRFFGTHIDLGATDIYLLGSYSHLNEDDFLI